MGYLMSWSAMATLTRVLERGSCAVFTLLGFPSEPLLHSVGLLFFSPSHTQFAHCTTKSSWHKSIITFAHTFTQLHVWHVITSGSTITHFRAHTLYSRSFGFLDFQIPSPHPTSSGGPSSTSFLSKEFVQQVIMC